MDIGFIGLGQMGFHMARRLVEAGHRLVVFDNRREAIERLTALGAQAAASPRELADAVETVMVSLPTPDVVLAVATGAGGVIEGKRVRRFVDLSTTGAVMAKRIFAALKTKDIVQIDCPVSGGVPGAANGPLALMTKDLKLCLAEGKALGVPMQVAEAVAQLLQTACDENGSDKDLTTVVQPVERRAGVEVRAPRASGPLPK